MKRIFSLLPLLIATLGACFLTPQLVLGQTDSSSQGVGNAPHYPSGTRVYPNGRISTPNGNVVLPSTTINNGNGSTTYYYQNGTRITIPNKTINPNGTFLAPRGLNGGLRTSPNDTFSRPGRLNGGFRNP